MNRFFVENTDEISGEDAHHIKNVLRLKEGDGIICIKNKKEFLCNIDKFEKNSIILRVGEALGTKISEEKPEITLMQGLPKGDKLEFIIEKAVETGVYEVIPLKLSRSISKVSDKDVEKKLIRWGKISKSAAQQSNGLFIPRVTEPKTIKQLDFSKYDLKIICYEDEKKTRLKDILKKHKSPKSIAIIIGPEGGISKEEIEFLTKNGFSPASLGERILRTETAGIYGMASINYHYS